MTTKTFKDLEPGEIFEIVHPWKDVPRQKMMKVVNVRTHFNAVYINWRRGTLDYIFDNVQVVSLGNIYTGD